jgi:hypothetical protein
MPMRLPNEFRNSVVFLGTAERYGEVRYRGTAFLVGVPVPGLKNLYHTYLATAGHSIKRAQNTASRLFVRWNTNDGESVVVETTTDWFFHDDEAVDLALLDVEVPNTREIGLVPVEAFATDELLKEHDFGLGDEVVATGLFYFRQGKRRNLPVLRTGIVASMPDEPFTDEVSGLPYDAYLIEMRSFGGLSGTPVFTVIHRGMLMNRPGRVFSSLVHQLALIGVVRGHWNVKKEQNDFFADDVEQANVGLTIVTPAQKLTELLMRDELVKKRRDDEKTLPSEEPSAAPGSV